MNLFLITSFIEALFNVVGIREVNRLAGWLWEDAAKFLLMLVLAWLVGEIALLAGGGEAGEAVSWLNLTLFSHIFIWLSKGIIDSGKH